MKHWKGLSPLLAMMMLVTFILAACSSGDSGNSAGSEGEDLKPVTITYFSADSNANWASMQDAVGKKLTETTGVTIQAEFAVDGSNQKLPLMVASGEYPDLVYAKGDATAKLTTTPALPKRAELDYITVCFLVMATARRIRPEIIIRPTSRNKSRPIIRHQPKKR